jgi:hypothetical protein
MAILRSRDYVHVTVPQGRLLLLKGSDRVILIGVQYTPFRNHNLTQQLTKVRSMISLLKTKLNSLER